MTLSEARELDFLGAVTPLFLVGSLSFLSNAALSTRSCQHFPCGFCLHPFPFLFQSPTFIDQFALVTPGFGGPKSQILKFPLSVYRRVHPHFLLGSRSPRFYFPGAFHLQVFQYTASPFYYSPPLIPSLVSASPISMHKWTAWCYFFSTLPPPSPGHFPIRSPSSAFFSPNLY